jgi:PAS domain S-box-containing protein
MTGLRGGDTLRCLHSLDDPKGCGYGPFCEICVVRNTVLETFKAGKGFLQKEAQLPFDIDGKTVELSLLVSTATLKVSERQMVLVCLENITERKKAEEALRRSEEHYRMLAETMNDGLQQIDETGRYVYVNNKMGEILGYSPDEMIGGYLTDFFDENAQKIMNKQLIRRKKGVAEPYEIENTRKDGQRIFIRISPQPIFDEKGEFRGSFAVVTDITEHRRVEEALQESEKKLQNIFSFSPDMIAVCDPEGKFLKVSPSCERILGYTVNETLKLGWAKLVHPDDVERTNKEVEKQLKGSPVANFINRFRCKDGTYKALEWQATPAIDGVVYAAARDITEKKKAEEEIKNLAKFPSENPYPVLRIAKDGTVLYANKASSLLLDTWQSTKGQALSTYWREFVFVALRSGHVQQAECECGDRVFSISFAPVKDTGYVNVYGLDITGRKEAEKKLLDHQAQLKTLASQLTLTEERERRQIAVDLHDHVSQSLSFSKMKLEALRKSESSAQAKQDLGQVCDQLGQAIDNTRSLTFDLSSPVLYELGLEVAVADWLKEQIEQKHGIKTEFADDGRPKTLDDDIRALLFRDVRELLVNIVKHAHANKVKVSIRKAGTHIQVCIEDDGVGFDPAETASMAAGRAEFGLFSIRERLEELGGLLEIDSAPGGGCNVTMTAPLKDAKK